MCIRDSLGRMAVETVTDSVPGYKFELGRAAALREGSDLTICATRNFSSARFSMRDT